MEELELLESDITKVRSKMIEEIGNALGLGVIGRDSVEVIAGVTRIWMTNIVHD